jgi:hypothetical protein
MLSQPMSLKYLAPLRFSSPEPWAYTSTSSSNPRFTIPLVVLANESWTGPQTTSARRGCRRANVTTKNAQKLLQVLNACWMIGR